MIVIGVDAHKSTHAFVAVDEVGRKLAELTAKATTDGHLSAIEWATQWPQLQFALEDCRHVTRRLEADLLNRGHAAVRVKTQLMAVHRRSAREPGKSDPIDAHAVAMAALREPNLPIARLDGPPGKSNYSAITGTMWFAREQNSSAISETSRARVNSSTL